MYINTNVPSNVTQNYLRMNDADLKSAMERLSSGKRINTAADDAAGLAIATRMTAQTNGMETATRNAQDGISLIQTAESALGSISDILQRVRELAVQADNGTYSAADKTSIQSEITDLVAEVDHISQNTTFNGISLLNGSAASVDLHISEKATDTLTVNLSDAQSTALGGTVDTLTNLDVTDDVTWGPDTGAQAAIKIVDESLDQISTQRASLGSKQNRLDFISNNLQVTKQNTEAARSRIEDANMAKESSELTKSKILSQSSMAMLKQANSAPQGVLQLLQG